LFIATFLNAEISLVALRYRLLIFSCFTL
jgi:hypothetical protein